MQKSTDAKYEVFLFFINISCPESGLSTKNAIQRTIIYMVLSRGSLLNTRPRIANGSIFMLSNCWGLKIIHEFLAVRVRGFY